MLNHPVNIKIQAFLMFDKIYSLLLMRTIEVNIKIQMK